ncbi:MAG: glycosyltransferase family 2 protein [Calditrichaceae bacterium]
MYKYDMLIPAYNAQNTLPILFEQINQLDKKPETIFVVNDGSTDRTGQIALSSGAKVISLDTNHGKGFALREGYKAFKESGQSDLLICLDADLQHPVHSVPEFLDHARKLNSKIIIGNREKIPSKMPAARIISNRITSFILSFLTGQQIKDSQCGYRLIHKNVLENLEFSEDGFQLESEFLIKAAQQNYNIEFVNIPTIYTGGNSHIHHFNDTVKFIRLILREIYKKL